MNEPKNWQIAGRSADWWIGVIALGLVFGIMAYLKTQS